MKPIKFRVVGSSDLDTLNALLQGLSRVTAAAPTTADFPQNGDWGLHKNSTTGAISLVINDNGTIKTVVLG